MKNLNTKRNLIAIILLNFFHLSNCDVSTNFPFGASTSSCQIEDAWNAEGKGENRCIDHGANENLACNSYYQYEEDSEYLSGAGFNVHRLSISWPRILPNGTNTYIDPAGVEYYQNLIDNLLKKNVQPMITMYHWDHPQTLEDLGGWRNSSMIQYMENYADVLFRLFGDKVKWWITINEPIASILFADKTTTNYASPDDDLIIIHNILRSHGRIFRLYDRKYRTSQNGKISISLNSDYCKPKTSSEDDAMAAEISFQLNTGIVAGPIYSNESDYPALVKEIMEAYGQLHGRSASPLPTFTDEEKQQIKGSFDFYAINHYNSRMCSWIPPNVGNVISTVFYGIDINILMEIDQKWSGSPKLDRWKVAPWGLREILKLVKIKYNNPPVFITENGYSDQGQFNDVDRISYHRDYITKMLIAMGSYGCNVIGYTV